jgi:hypothetical protein
VKWDADDVSYWLSSKGLDQYISIFRENQINGQVLLDITQEDLDYLEITALGHRKLILKGIEELKRIVPSSNTSFTANMRQSLPDPPMQRKSDGKLMSMSLQVISIRFIYFI